MDKFNKWLFLVTLIGYLFFTVTLFMPFSDCFLRPASNYDFAFTFTNALNSTEHFKELFSPAGYNPDFGAGRSEAQSVSARVFVLFNLLLTPLPPALAYNVAVFIILISIPLLFWYSLFLVGFCRKRQEYGVMLLTLFLMGSHIGQEFIYIGHIGFLFSTATSFVAAGFLLKYLKDRKLRCLIFQAVWCGITVWCHALSTVTLAALYLTCFASRHSKIFFKDVIYFFLFIVLFSIIPNLFWGLSILDYVQYVFEKNTYYVFFQTWGKYYLDQYDAMFAMVILLCGWKIKSYWSLLKKPFFFFLPFVMVSVLGSQIGLGDLEPVRYLLPLSFVCVSVISFYQKKMQFMIGSFFIIIIINKMFFITQYRNWDHTVGCNFKDSEGGQQLLGFMKEEMSNKSRLLVQDSILNVVYFNKRLVSMIPYLLDIPILSNPFPTFHSFYSFVDDTIFGSDLKSISDESFYKNLNIYNVGHILVFSKEAKDFMLRKKKMHQVFDDGRFMIFRVGEYAESYCYNCSAKISASLNRIEIENPSKEDILLKYHYLHTMQAIPPTVKIVPVCLGSDPHGFIRVKSGNVKRITILNEKQPYINDGVQEFLCLK